MPVWELPSAFLSALPVKLPTLKMKARLGVDVDVVAVVDVAVESVEETTVVSGGSSVGLLAAAVVVSLTELPFGSSSSLGAASMSPLTAAAEAVCLKRSINCS